MTRGGRSPFPGISLLGREILRGARAGSARSCDTVRTRQVVGDWWTPGDGPGKAGHGRAWPKETNLSPRAVDAMGKPALWA